MTTPTVSRLPLVATSPDSEFSQQFLQGMLNRMSVSFHKYGAVEDAFPEKIDALASAWQRIQMYLDTKNTEYLIDAANFMMIEFMRPKLDGAEFKATDSDGSPGRIAADGHLLTIEKNVEL